MAKEASGARLTAGIGQRIDAAARAIGGKRRLAEQIEISEPQLYRLISGEHQPKVETLVAIARAAGVRLEWLATGEGPMRPDEASVAHGPPMVKGAEGTGPATAPYKDVSTAPAGWIGLPRYEVEASAGGGVLVHSEQIVDYLAFREEWLRHNGMIPSRVCLVEVRGDSMKPTIDDGELVLVDLSLTRMSDGVWLLSLDDVLLVKRVRVRLRGIEVVSDNAEHYPPELVPKEEADQRLRLIGLVRWAMRRW